jgi:hypothetical protein
MMMMLLHLPPNKNHSIERHAVSNKALRGFFCEMDMITEELDDSCPGLVLCADTLALATRYGVFWYVLLLLFLCMVKHSTADLLAI